MIPILDAGHGKVINGVYQTSGKRSPKWHKGVLYEGMFNNWVVNRIIEKLDRANIPYYHLNPEYEDIPLLKRAKRADRFYRDSNKDAYILSIHANGGGGRGIEGFTYLGNSKSDYIAEKFLENLECDVSYTKMRFDYSDGDKDKESNFYILRVPKAPAVLLELGFMDNKEDYNLLWDENHLGILVNSISKTIIDLYNE